MVVIGAAMTLAPTLMNLGGIPSGPQALYTPREDIAINKMENPLVSCLLKLSPYLSTVMETVKAVLFPLAAEGHLQEPWKTVVLLCRLHSMAWSLSLTLAQKCWMIAMPPVFFKTEALGKSNLRRRILGRKIWLRQNLMRSFLKHSFDYRKVKTWVSHLHLSSISKLLILFEYSHNSKN